MADAPASSPRSGEAGVSVPRSIKAALAPGFESILRSGSFCRGTGAESVRASGFAGNGCESVRESVAAGRGGESPPACAKALTPVKAMVPQTSRLKKPRFMTPHSTIAADAAGQPEGCPAGSKQLCDYRRRTGVFFAGASGPPSLRTIIGGFCV